VTRVTIQDTTGVNGYRPARPRAAEPGVTRVTIQDTTGVSGYQPARSRAAEPGVTRVTIQDTTGVNSFARTGRAVMGGRPPGGHETPPVDAGPQVIVPFPVTLRPAANGQRQSLTITSDAPIDTPIVILGP
jgi:hypothetical protein